MRLSTCILPVHQPGEARRRWREAEDLGFHAGYTYDHLNWREPFRDGTWYEALLTLSLAASVTSELRLGTLVTTPNFRTPVTLAKELVTLDAICAGRLTLGLGAGTDGYDAAILGTPALTPRQRHDRFEEFTRHLDVLLTTPSVTLDGAHYRAVEARTIPACVQAPRVPFAVAATGPRGLRLAAEIGQAWVTTGDPATFEGGTPDISRAAVRAQVGRLEEACDAVGRDPGAIERILLTGFLPEDTTASPAAFGEAAAAYAEVGITEIVVHAPIPGTLFALEEDVYAGIAALAPELAAL
ncbi:LLM class flavin-dependent oxidoreductase [Miniimonas arenae]|uniref:LLM class flavin-dependent oxidoreductase n=1 Tax=Miniimonas arenae TaxID=676201 RepID=A0A5C5BFP6_9MICO|nr:LLM class flavin-dependent oxidoreductase [Miniimonas arenae]TNU76837.1 LLM class flavin-dependent oxidoreductase [Miniimonas arenae]